MRIKTTLPAASTLLLLLLVPLTLLAQDASDLPRPQGYVNDFAGVLSSSEEESIRRLAESVERATGAQVAVAVVETIAPYASIEEYSIALAEAWGVGSGEEDNGVLLLLSMGERRVRMEVGFGLEGAITDGTAGAILDRAVLPALGEGRYGAGLRRGVEAISAEIAEEYDVDLTAYGASEEPRRLERTNGSSPGGIGRIVYLLIFLFFFGGGRFFWPLLFLTGGGRRFYGGGFGAGNSSGGFSGFGGGGFGGGGASRGF
ncbi:MAG: TPM domain-containing protein [Alkalispirochaetaceae bacterium]